jgi:putative hydrolase of the HAD superfamily
VTDSVREVSAPEVRASHRLDENSVHGGISIPDTVVVFDYGDVISTPTEAHLAALTDLAGGDGPAFWAAYWRHRDALDQGEITVLSYWRNIQRDLGRHWEAARVHALGLADFRGWLDIDEGTLSVLEDLQRGATRMALLSNAGRDFAAYYRYGMLGDFFEKIFVSSELGALKPAPQVFQAVLTGLNVAPNEIVFIDDRHENVRGATAVGIIAYQFTTAENLRVYLEGLAAERATR